MIVPSKAVDSVHPTQYNSTSPFKTPEEPFNLENGKTDEENVKLEPGVETKLAGWVIFGSRISSAVATVSSANDHSTSSNVTAPARKSLPQTPPISFPGPPNPKTPIPSPTSKSHGPNYVPIPGSISFSGSSKSSDPRLNQTPKPSPVPEENYLHRLLRRALERKASKGTPQNTNVADPTIARSKETAASEHGKTSAAANNSGAQQKSFSANLGNATVTSPSKVTVQSKTSNLTPTAPQRAMASMPQAPTPVIRIDRSEIFAKERQKATQQRQQVYAVEAAQQRVYQEKQLLQQQAAQRQQQQQAIQQQAAQRQEQQQLFQQQAAQRQQHQQFLQQQAAQQQQQGPTSNGLMASGRGASRGE